ncbi:PREDICTED: serine/threonine-protein phosphatase 6 regulatory ankyrin repeat subunit C-like [Amphimedon queenslandica]|uniref:Uncharacterized protein n=2 Tax=Amphimedon queenslandica TaxID=400682 RepID=A0AAN0JYC7_AMPQE|nr:PREDICTED: serine/threonine-protein phosphatase 6 regulatory ankyrin repeat subunit C-like [Amphimedon queenslandica]|eukprot:XP_019862114.1 PREDICTED: serine/threonine-protein phosphatase 6 regulatory ankyrin repeat subunit C-like [Amphimedon queenslandica]
MIKLVGVFLPENRSLKRTWSEYEEKLKDYFINSGGLLKDADAVQFGIKGVPPGTRVMIAKVDRDDYTLDDLFFFRRAIPEGLDVPEYDLHFRSIHLSSLCLGYLISEYLYSLLFPLTTKLQQQLASIGITELTCGEDKYDLREFSIEEVKHSSTDIDICDPLWYENTSTPLHEAAWRGLKDEVQWLLNKFGYSTYHRGLHGWTPLHSASYGGHIEILQLLIDQYGIDPNEGDDNSVSSIHMASYKGHLSIVKYLVDTCDVPPDQPDNSNNTALLYSAMGGHSDLVEFFIERNCNTSQINCVSASLSLLACQSGELALVHKLESLNLFSPDSTDFYGLSILHYSSMSNNAELFKYLLNRYQLSIDVKDQYGRTLLHIASWFASSSVVEYIVSIQDNEALLVNDNDGYSWLHRACNAGIHFSAGIVYSKLMAQSDVPVIQIINTTQIKQNIDFIKQNERVKMFSSLLKKASTCPNFDINAATNDGWSLLHLASWSGSTLLVKALEEYNINCTLDNDDVSPVHFAAWSGSTSVLSYIISQYKLNANDTDTYGRTPLVYSCQADNEGRTLVHHAAWSGNFDLVQYLITEQVWKGHLNVLKYLIDNNYCNPNATNHQGRTPLHVAVAANKYEILEYLLSKSIPSMSVVWLPCQDGKQNMVSLLLKASLSNNNLFITNKKGQTPLHLAAASGHKDTTEALLFSVTGSSTHHDLLTATDNEGFTVLHTACSNGHIDVFRYLSSIYPQGVNVMDNRGRGLLHAACEGGDIGIVRTLIETHGLDPLAEDENGITCLHLLAERTGTWMRMIAIEKSIEIYQYLEPNIVSNPVPKDKSGRTPLHYASCSDNIRMVRYLIETFPCTPDDPDNNEYTSVHGACEAGSMELVQYFLTDLKCNALAETDDCKTMLYFASISSNLELVRFLVDVFSLKPRPHDIEIAQSVNPDSSVVKYLQKVNTGMIFDMMEEEKKFKETYHQKLEQQQQTNTQRQDIPS